MSGQISMFQYVNAEILFPKGDKMAVCQVKYQKHHTDGNSNGRTNDSHIIATCLYEVKFLGGKKQN